MEDLGILVYTMSCASGKEEAPTYMENVKIWNTTCVVPLNKAKVSSMTVVTLVRVIGINCVMLPNNGYVR